MQRSRCGSTQAKLADYEVGDMSDADWFTLARHWKEREPDERFAREIERLVSEGDAESLRKYFSSNLSFGTAGLRGKVGWGSGSMNEANVARASWALGQYLLFSRFANKTQPSVVIGFDARHQSRGYALLCAEILLGMGCRVVLSDGPVPTPLIAFLARDQGHQAAVVVTASHNPRGDNGFKVYDELGVQIISPWDVEIGCRMRAFPPWTSIERTREGVQTVSVSDESRYLDYVEGLARAVVPCLRRSGGKIGYSPLHGVAGSWVESALQRACPGVELVMVPEQAQPDGSFPTTPFPNPEEPGALDRLIALGRAHSCDLLLANDPDGDRLAAALKEGDSYLRLSGDALGLLFADACLSATNKKRPVLVSSIVSSPALDALAQTRDAQVVRTLTGFKWLCRAAIEHEDFVFAYEEALGYCFASPTKTSRGVMDKDGVAAATIVSRLLLASREVDLLERLRQLYSSLGLFGSFGRNRRFVANEKLSAMDAMDEHMKQLRLVGPRLASGWRLAQVDDYEEGAARRPSYLGRQNLLHFQLEPKDPASGKVRDAQVLVRPSGTEPKLKAYVHLRCNFDANRLLSRQLEELEPIADELSSGFLSLASHP